MTWQRLIKEIGLRGITPPPEKYISNATENIEACFVNALTFSQYFRNLEQEGVFCPLGDVTSKMPISIQTLDISRCYLSVFYFFVRAMAVPAIIIQGGFSVIAHPDTYKEEIDRAARVGYDVLKVSGTDKQRKFSKTIPTALTPFPIQILQ